MIIADTNIIIDFWNNPTEKARHIFADNDIATCGVIKTELLRGARSEKQFTEFNEALNDFSYLFFDESDWIELAEQFIEFRRNGLTVPFQDAMIAYLGIKYNCSIWTNDNHFKLMQVVLPKLQIFDAR